jgi:AAA domain-containing protein
MTTEFSLSIEPIAKQLLGEPNARLSSKDELRYGSRGSLSIDLRKGTWFDHEANEGGGVLDLITKQTGLDGPDRSRWLDEHGYSNGKDRSPRARAHIVATYDYPDEVGVLLFQVVRFEPKDFRQRKPDKQKPDEWAWTVKGVRQVPYRLPDLLEHIEQVVFIAEGEKCCEDLWKLGVPATTNAGGAGKWRPELCEFFRNADVVIIPDYDPQKRNPKTNELMFHDDGRPILPGQDHAQDVAAQLAPVAARVRVLELWKHWADMPLKGDVSDWIEAGGTADALYALVEQTPLWTPTQINGHDQDALLPVEFPFPIDEQGIPLRDWIVPGLLLRSQVTVLVAPSGSGKSLLTLQIGIACAQGVAWSGWIPRGKSRVLIINSEDDGFEIRRRLAAAARPDAHIGFDVDQVAIRNMLALIDASQASAVIAEFDIRKKKLVHTPRFDKLVSTILANKFDLVFVDPFAETFEGDENSNSELKWAGMLWREVARRTNAAVCLVHHTKKYATGMAGDVDAARGAGALIGIARIVSTVFPMTTKEAEAMGVASEQRGFFLRYDDAKANLNIISPFARWFRKDTVTLDNKSDELPGDDVGVLVPWKPKGPSVLEAQILAFFTRLDQGVLDDDGKPTGEFYTFEKGRSGERYVATFAREFFALDALSQAEEMIKNWRKGKRLQEIQYRSAKSRKMRNRVISELSPDCPKNKNKDTASPDQQFEFEAGKQIGRQAR